MSASLQLMINGRATPVRSGQTVAGALIEAGISSWRTTRRYGRPRGAFCGIGVCFDCLAEIDGIADRRSCLVRVRDGMQVRVESGPPDSDRHWVPQ